MTLEAAYRALTDEAKEWDDTSKALSDASDTVEGLNLVTADFSWIAFTTDVDASYEEARQFVLDVLEAGTGETQQLGDALRQIRSDYESTDEDVVAAVKKNWVPE